MGTLLEKIGLKKKKKKWSFLVKLEKFNNLPVIIHVDQDCKVEAEFLNGGQPTQEILEEIERIAKG